MVIFEDRYHAGTLLAKLVASVIHDPDALVLALPRGGVPVGFEVARRLPAALDIFLVRKLGLPGQEELAIGAIASGGFRILNHELIEELNLSQRLIDQLTAREKREMERREMLYRQGRPPFVVTNRSIILVDDGLATGASMKAAALALRHQHPKRVIAAAPIAAKQTVDELRAYVSEVICPFTPEPLLAIGNWYLDFSQTTDDEVLNLLNRSLLND